MKKARTDLDHCFNHKDKHMVLRWDSGTTSIQQVDYSDWVPVFSDPTDEELSEFYDSIKKLIAAEEGSKNQGGNIPPATEREDV